MKRTLALWLALFMALSLCACGGEGTELTLDNYGQYLNVEAHAGTSGDSITNLYPRPHQSPEEEPVHLTLHNAIGAQATVSGTSTNFNYNDVVVKVKVTATYSTPRNGYGDTTWSIDEEPLEFVLEVKTDISGTGKETTTKSISTYKACSVESCKFEVLEITGTVTPA